MKIILKSANDSNFKTQKNCYEITRILLSVLFNTINLKTLACQKKLAKLLKVLSFICN